MKKWIAASALVLAGGGVAQGLPGIDLEVGAGYGMHNLNDGQIGDDVSLVDDSSKTTQLDLGDTSGLYLRGQVGVPILPKLKFQYQPMTFESDSASSTFDLPNGNSVAATGSVKLDMSHLDTSLYYGLPDLAPGIDYYVDLGLNLRWLLGGMDVTTSNGTESADFTGLPLPAGHIAGGVTIPGIDLELSGKLNTLPIDGLTYRDWNLKARYYVPTPVAALTKIGVEAGYRSWMIDVDNDDVKLNMETSGLFAGVSAGF